MTNRYHNLEAFRRTVAEMMADPDITGDLLLVGIWLARCTILGEPPRRSADGTSNMNLTAIARDLYGRGDSYTVTGFGETRTVKNHHVNAVIQALRSDIPRYDWEADNERLWRPFGGYQCAAPMVRREGPCGQHATHERHLTDTSTGRIHVLAACNRHKAWLNEQWLRNRDEVRALGEHLPTPPMNAGGALARHIHGIAWARWYQRLDSSWKPPAEGEPTRKPTLTVLTFEPDDEDQQPAAGDRPALTVVEGGWR